LTNKGFCGIIIIEIRKEVIKMKMTKTEMINEMIMNYGHEHKSTIWFIKLVEDYPHGTDEQFQAVFEALVELIKTAKKYEERD
jgi:hypothetical protein